MTDLDQAMDKLLSVKEHRMPALMDLAQLLFVGVDFERGFAAGLANKHGGLRLSAGMLAAYARHRALLQNGTGLKDWSAALAKELSNGRLEETTASKPKLTQLQEDVIQGLMRLGKKRAEVEEIVLNAPPGAADDQSLFQWSLAKLDTERKAS